MTGGGRHRFAPACVALGLAALMATSAAAGDLAFEVTSPEDGRDVQPGDGRCATAAGACSLRAAIDEANALGRGVTISVGPGRYAVDAPLQVTSPVLVRGASPREVVVMASPAFAGRRLVSFAGADKVTWRSLEGFTLDANGRAGVVETLDGIPLRLSHMVIKGGAIGFGAEGSRVNEAPLGGDGTGEMAAQAGGAGIAAMGPLAVEQTSVVDNRIGELGGRGGALIVENGPAWITQSTFTGNTGPNSAGIFARNAKVALEFVSLVGNSGRPVGGYQQNPHSRLRVRGSWFGESIGNRKFDCRSTAEGGGIESGGDNVVAVTGPTGERLIDGVWRPSWEFACPFTGANDTTGTLAHPLEGAWRRVTDATGLMSVVATEKHPAFRAVNYEECPKADAWGRTLKAGERCDKGALRAQPAELTIDESKDRTFNLTGYVGIAIIGAGLAAIFYAYRRRRRAP